MPGGTFFPNLSKVITFAAAPLVLSPCVRNQEAPDEDVRLLQQAITAVNRMGDFPSKASLERSEERLAEVLKRGGG